MTDKLMPDGIPIGRRGRGLDVQLLPGGRAAAEGLFDYLRVGGSDWGSTRNRTVIRLPGNAGFITYRPNSKSGGPAVDVNVPGVKLKLHFLTGSAQ